MHHLYFAKISKKQVKTSEEAITEAVSGLDRNQFCGDGGYFTSHKSDWYVVGGRWSGILSEIDLDIDFLKEVKSILNIKDFISMKDIDDNEDKIQKLWEKLGGVGKNSLSRKGGNHSDDAFIIKSKLLKKLQKRFEKEDIEVAIFDEDGSMESEITINDLNEKDYGDWLIVIDYHD
jgi:hypothetical protein